MWPGTKVGREFKSIRHSIVQTAVKGRKFWSSKAVCYIFTYSNSKRFNHYRKGGRNVSTFVYRLLLGCFLSTPFAPFYPLNSVQSVTSVVEQGPFQQSTSATPMVSVKRLTNQSSVLAFAAVTAPLPSTYTLTSTQQLSSCWSQLSLCPPGTINNFHCPLRTRSAPTLLPCSKELVSLSSLAKSYMNLGKQHFILV